MYRQNWKTLIMPKEVKVVEQNEAGTFARFICEPLMKGYGITLGNSLRRILLSSIRGAAIVAVKIKGVEHEFSTIPGVKEDVVNVFLNLKQIRFVAHEEKMHHLVLRRKNKGMVTAGDIPETAAIKILNKDQVLFEMDENVDVEMELLVMSGRGYVPAEDHDPSLYSEGFIPIDSFFSPVVRVSYAITGARVKNNFNYDKLTIEVETDGAMHPRDALAYASMILREHTRFLINFAIEEETEGKEGDLSEETDWNLYKTIDDLDLSVRSYNCLKSANIRFVGDLVKKSEAEMLKTKNFGRKSLNEIKLILLNMGLYFGMELPNFPDQRILDQIEKKKEKEGK
ncbi:MAG TPA: DNA-directed RNA polymerase subunit alpha [bacterium]|nr:DNA-directed RNA polymerase subunit alpha [bacterium]